MIFKESFKIGLKDIGKSNEINNGAILEYLENVASYHSDSVGNGINTSDETQVLWLLLDWKIKVIKRPKYGQTLNIHTWSRGFVKCYAYRDFEIYNEQGELCVIASSKWLLVSKQTKKIAKVDSELGDKYESEPDRTVFKEEIGKIKEPDNFKSSIIYQIKRKDIDVIGHVHNIYYLDLAYEALPQEIYEQRPFDEIRIMYKKEIKIGETVICKYSNEDDKHIVVIKSEDEKTLHAIIELKSLKI